MFTNRRACKRVEELPIRGHEGSVCGEREREIETVIDAAVLIGSDQEGVRNEFGARPKSNRTHSQRADRSVCLLSTQQALAMELLDGIAYFRDEQVRRHEALFFVQQLRCGKR